jgi:putative OPT family oligopeptide transporter
MTEDKKFVPFVSAETNMKEFTLRALLIGLVLSVVLGAANAYIGLKAGMTIAATYPAAVIGMAVLRMLKGSILEENFARTAGSIGESVAAGAIFTLPAFYIAGIWSGEEFSSFGSYISATLILITGGTLGVLFVALLRRVMVEDKELPFPESVAAAEIHKAGQSGGGGTKYLFGAMLVGALIKFAGEIKLFATGWTTFLKSAPATLTASKTSIQGGFFAGGPAISSAYLGVGYIIGPRLAALSFSGLLLAWGLMVPILLALLGSDYVTSLKANAGLDPASMEAWRNASVSVWQEIVRIIAIGGMLIAACFTLYRMRESLGTGLKRAVRDLKRAAQGADSNVERTERDLKPVVTLIGICVAAVLTFAITYFVFNTSVLVAFIASTVMIILAFLFAAVSGYLVGIIGSSNNPVSGLTITALVITALLLVICGVRGDGSQQAITVGVAAVLGVAAIVCVSAAVAGEMFQDLKAGHILGGTPWKMQTGNLIGAVVSASVMFGVLIILNQGDINTGLHQGYEGGFGSATLPAPQAFLMATLSQGIVGGSMTWILIVVGMMLCAALILMGIKGPMLIFVGMYLPFATVFAIFAGGLIKGILDLYLARKKLDEGQTKTAENTSVLLASGLIAGEALMGLVIAVFAVFNKFFTGLLGIEKPAYFVGLAVITALAYFLVRIPYRKALSTK